MHIAQQTVTALTTEDTHQRFGLTRRDRPTCSHFCNRRACRDALHHKYLHAHSNCKQAAHRSAAFRENNRQLSVAMVVNTHHL